MNFKPVKSAAIAAGILGAVALAAPAAANGPDGPPPIADLPLIAGYGPPPPPAARLLGAGTLGPDCMP